ncbi:metal ABC transporter substrate-binding protein [Halobaculum lipolyticum]|uniref:Metal ABC transporter substrate-binding protein n=1 Tax=Halobaculum lipolyticum TaxID=3032001 RepID=A0ABD5WG97_9EURY|nr:metal ABC transporter substrate-binding protein [Halobaculum sp. DT31]
MEHTRRSLLASAGALAAGTVAGCLGDAGATNATDATDGPAAQASFFVFGDVASAVAGDATATDLLVPVGQHGHGWEPGPRVRESIRDADLLVHGMEGFQPWVDDVLGDLAADDADVAAVDASVDVDLLAAGEGEDGDHDDEHEGDHDGEHHEEEPHTEEHTESGDHDEESGDGHDHGSTDPHFWMDPTRVRTATATVRDALSEVDPDAADAHAANAESFRASLTALDERLAALVGDAPRDTVFVAGHDSFGYLAERYGLHVEALTGVGPDDQPTTRDVERAREVVETHDLRFVCADPIESQRAADQIVAETAAEEVLPLTAIPGLTAEWAAEDWGYLDVMENVNLPTLERVLGE